MNTAKKENKSLFQCSCSEYEYKQREAVGTGCVCQEIDLDSNEIVDTRPVYRVTIQHTLAPKRR